MYYKDAYSVVLEFGLYVSISNADQPKSQINDGTFYRYVRDCKEVHKLYQTLSSVVLTSRQELNGVLTQYQTFQNLYTVDRDITIKVNHTQAYYTQNRRNNILVGSLIISLFDNMKSPVNKCKR